jgi:signal peptidase II
VLLCDLLSKHLVSSGAFSGEYLGGFLRVTLIHNPGAAFGIFPGAGLILIIIKIVALAAILFLIGRSGSERGSPMTVALALIFGGALGNLLDRFRNGGEVVDFLDLGFGDHRWYVFNLADAAISIGACVLVLLLLRRPEPREEVA